MIGLGIGLSPSLAGVAVVASGAALNTLTLSGALVQGAASSGTISGATAGSSIAPRLVGLTVNNGAGTYAYDGTAFAGTQNDALVETKAGASNSPNPSPLTVGPVAINGITPGTAGSETFNTGYTLSGGDDFTAFAYIGPQNPRNNYATQKGAYASSGAEPRGSPGLAAYDVDPLHTGDLDTNRGVAVPGFSTSIVQSGTELTLLSRNAVAADQPFMSDPRKTAIGAMVHTVGAFLAQAPMIFEWSEKRTSQTGSHISGWMQQLPPRTYNDLELDFEAGTPATQTAWNINSWVNGVDASSSAGNVATTNGTYYRCAIRVDQVGTATFWMDTGSGFTLRGTYSGSQAQALTTSFFLLFTNHSIQGSWATGGGNATQTIDWYRVWNKGGAHFTPLVAGATYSVDYGASATFTLPTATTVWGSAVGERIDGLGVEINEPGGDAFGLYDPLPTGITYNSGTRALAITSAVTKPGRLHTYRSVTGAGNTCNPQHILVEIGPNIDATAFNLVVNQAVSLDLYPICDVGQILPKVITVSGLPGWLTLSGTTLTGTAPSGATSGSFTITCTNASGQAQTITKSYAVVTMPGVFVYDTMTGPLMATLQSRAGEIGATWTRHPLAAPSNGDLLDGNGGLYFIAASSTCIYYASGTPGTTDHTGKMVIKVLTTPTSGEQKGICVRLDTAALTFYAARYIHGTGVLLTKSVAGTITQLGTTFVPTPWATGETHELDLAVSGTTTTSLVATLDGTAIISLTDTTSPITAAGRIGLRTFQGDVSTKKIGMHVDSITGTL